jgi:hypothetical protein
MCIYTAKRLRTSKHLARACWRRRLLKSLEWRFTQSGEYRPTSVCCCCKGCKEMRRRWIGRMTVDAGKSNGNLGIRNSGNLITALPSSSYFFLVSQSVESHLHIAFQHIHSKPKCPPKNLWLSSATMYIGRKLLVISADYPIGRRWLATVP